MLCTMMLYIPSLIYSNITICARHSEWGTFYEYTADLLALDLCGTSGSPGHPLLSLIRSPLLPGAWNAALRNHPDRAFVRYLIRGLTEGFRIGFSSTAPLHSAPRNMLSDRQHPEVVRAYLTNECALGRMLGPFPPALIPQLPPLQVNRFGVKPKGHNSGKWRLITDLSYPPGLSVNDGIDSNLCSLTYSSVEQVAAVAASFLPGALLAKIYIKSAYRLVPVHPLDRPLQAVEWEGMLYVDPMLPFGLRSAPKFSMRWRTRWNGVYEHMGSNTSSTIWTTLSSLDLPTPPHVLRPWQSLTARVPS